MAANIRSRSDCGVVTEPDGDSVRGGVESVAGIERGVEGWSGAEAVAFGASRSRESCEPAGDGEGDFAGEEDLDKLSDFLAASICSASFMGS